MLTSPEKYYIINLGEKMPSKKYAFVSDGKVFDIFLAHSIAEKYQDWIAGFSSNPIGMDISLYPNAKIGSTWNGVEFTHDNDLPPKVRDNNRFAFLSDNKIFWVRGVAEDGPTLTVYKEAFSKNVIAVEILEGQTVSIGSSYDGSNFVE